MRSTQSSDWDPAKPFGPKAAHATKEAEKFAKLSETSVALMGRLGIYLQRTQGFISGAFVAREGPSWPESRSARPGRRVSRRQNSRRALQTTHCAISLANFLTAAITLIVIRQKLEVGFDRRVQFMSVALSKGVVPHMAKLRLKELPLTKGTLFAGEWTTTVESTTEAQLLSVTNLVLGEPPVTVFGSPLKRAKGPEAVRPRKARTVEGTPPLPLISSVTRKVPVVAVAKAEEAAPKKMPTPPTTPPSHPPLSPMLNDRPGPGGGGGGGGGWGLSPTCGLWSPRTNLS